MYTLVYSLYQGQMVQWYAIRLLCCGPGFESRRQGEKKTIACFLFKFYVRYGGPLKTEQPMLYKGVTLRMSFKHTSPPLCYPWYMHVQPGAWSKPIIWETWVQILQGRHNIWQNPRRLKQFTYLDFFWYFW